MRRILHCFPELYLLYLYWFLVTGEVFYLGKVDFLIEDNNLIEPEYLSKKGFRDLYAGRNVLYLTDTKNCFYYYTEKDKLQKIDQKVHVSDIKVSGNNAFMYNNDNNSIYEFNISTNDEGVNLKKKVHVLSDLRTAP